MRNLRILLSRRIVQASLLLVMLVNLSACKKDTSEEEPQPVVNAFVGNYSGKMVTTGGVTNQGFPVTQTLAVTIEIKSSSKTGEVKWKIISPFGDYNDPLTATTTGTTFTTLKQKLTYGPGDEVTFEGSGTLSGSQLTATLQEDDGTGTYQHQITATKK